MIHNKNPSETPKDIIEKLSRLEHEQWVAWSKSIIENCGTEPVPEVWGQKLMEKHQRWIPLWVDYDELSEEMKEHDRKWARKVYVLALKEQDSRIAELEKKFKFVQKSLANEMIKSGDLEAKLGLMTDDRKELSSKLSKVGKIVNDYYATSKSVEFIIRKTKSVLEGSV